MMLVITPDLLVPRTWNDSN